MGGWAFFWNGALRYVQSNLNPERRYAPSRLQIVSVLPSRLRGCPPLVRVVWFAVAVALCILGYLFLLSLFRNHPLGAALAAALLAAAALGLNRGFLRSEGGSLANIGLNAPRRRLGQFGAAFLGGTVLVVAWALVAAGLTGAHLQFAAGRDWGACASLLLFYTFNNAAEELAYRAYAFLVLEKAYGRWFAIISTSVVFTLMHMQGGMPLPQAVAGTLTTGLLFGLLFARRKSLPLTLGFHLATNVMQDVCGLRSSALTLLGWSAENTSGQRGLAILGWVAGINLAVLAYLSRVRIPKEGKGAE